MRHELRRLGFRPKSGFGAELAGRRFLLSRRDLRVLDQLASMRDEIDPIKGTGRSLVSFRSEIREILTTCPRAALSEVILKTEDDITCRLALWLRGRCGGTIGTLVVAGCLEHPDPLVRREAARALRRIGAWSHLHQVVQTETDPRVLAMAKQHRPTDFADRLHRVIQTVQALPNSPTPQPLYISPDVDLRGGVKPKSVEVIRRILRRIRAILYGSGNAS